MPIICFYLMPGLSVGASLAASNKVKKIASNFDCLSTEQCFYIQCNQDLNDVEINMLQWILSTPFDEKGLTVTTSLHTEDDSSMLIEIGPRLNFSTPMSTNAVSICKSIGLTKVSRIEVSIRYLISFHGDKPSGAFEDRLVHCLHDKMTQCRYMKPIETFKLEVQSEAVYEVDIIGEGRSALEKANNRLGLALDDWDLDFYTNMFKDKVKRNPTNVECFDLAQSNSEHSRHWFFRGKLIIDGKEEEQSLFKMIMNTQNFTNPNNIIKFNDNSSGIKGYEVLVYKPADPTEPSKMVEINKETRHIIFTAETHNFPTGVAPFPGATTGTGGRIRDIHCTGRGAHVVAGTAGYCFGNLKIPGYNLPWEDESFDYPSNFASPLEIAIEASNGASDYGNKFGEPVLTGFARSFGMSIAEGDRREYIKPIMFSGGIGQLEDSHISKLVASKGMEVAKVGGPVYRIGVGGGAASSVQIQGDNQSELDFGAVQRGDAEMEQKLNRLIRACVEIEKNPIASIHDQGAGGNGNVLKEIVEPAGAIIRASDFQLGDPTISILELWGAEYQETNAILLARDHMHVLEKIGRRERCPVSFVGTVTGDGKICLENFKVKKRELIDAEDRKAKKQKVDDNSDVANKDIAFNGHENGVSENGATHLSTNGYVANGHVTSKLSNGKSHSEDQTITETKDGNDSNIKDKLPSGKSDADDHMIIETTNDEAGNSHVITKSPSGKSNADHMITETTKGDGDYILYPVNLELEHVLGKMPQKEFHLDHGNMVFTPMSIPPELTVREVLERVLRLPSVASKRYLTNKVDRCVTGLVAQQQCVGPLHTPLADVAVTALSYMEKVGSATSIGEQPIKGLIDPAIGARMSVGEALTNLVFAKVSDLKDVKCSGNWMWPAKLPGEGAALVDACHAMCDVMKQLGIAVDGGKDSLSMAARVGSDTVKAPGSLVVSAYVGCPDIMLTVTPDLKCPAGKGVLLYVNVSDGHCRLGGTAFAQCFQQLGNQPPDLDHPEAFKSAFMVTQKLIANRKIDAGHDVSDGGFLTCILEMAFAGNCGLDVDITCNSTNPIETLFHEELGLVLEVDEADVEYVRDAYKAENVSCILIGYSYPQGPDSQVTIKLNKESVLSERMTVLRDIWEETSYQLELLQANPDCVKQERAELKTRCEPPYKLTFNPDIVHIIPQGKRCPKVAVVREEGSNSDREMSAAFMMAGFEVWDVNMQDLCAGDIILERFNGIAFVGGFSYADVLGSAKGWAATVKFNEVVAAQFAAFRERKDTFSFGVCNGCQLMGLLGWVAPDVDCIDKDSQQGVFLGHNDSERFECRFVSVKVYNSPAIMFSGMEETVFGMWSAHGEGKMIFKNQQIYENLKSNNLIPVRYVNDTGEATTTYPFNPNGSPDGVAALCSPDGRHLAIMPHPERCFLPWQCPWMTREQRKALDASPWMKMFQNAFDWSVKIINSD